MKTQKEVLDAIRGGGREATLDGRDFVRLANFFPVTEWGVLGVALKDGVTKVPEPRPWTEDEIKLQLAEDVAFGFEKALDQRGISASLMNEVVKMWMWVLDDPLQSHDDYAQYGLPLLKAVATKYGLPNPIGGDDGDEDKYSCGF